MVVKLVMPWLLLALCVAIHAVGIMVALRRIERSDALSVTRFWPLTLFLVRMAGWLIVLHLLEISVWGSFYFWQQLMPGWNDAFYFSSVTYTTTGYGDLVLPQGWRLFGGIEALTGILMCGWSTGFFFAVVNRMFATRTGRG